jgi:hypothetical protein
MTMMFNKDTFDLRNSFSKEESKGYVRKGVSLAFS